MLPVLLTAAALAATPCTWEAPELKGFSAEVTSLADGTSLAAPFALDVPAREAGLKAKATLEADGGIALELADESVRVSARVAPGQAALHPTARLDLGGGLSVGGSGAVSVIGVEGSGVRVAASMRGFSPVKPTSSVVACTGLTLVSTQANERILGTHALKPGEHAIRATAGGPPIGTLSSATLTPPRVAIQILESDGDHRKVQIDDDGVRLVGWLPATALSEVSSGIGGLIGAKGMVLAPPPRYTCNSGTLYTRSAEGALGRVGELSPGATVKVLATEGELHKVGLADASWLESGAGQLVMKASTIEACELTTTPPVATAAASSPDGPVTRIGGDPLILGALDKSVIDAVIKKHLSEVRNCYTDGLEDNPKLAGKVVVKFTIAKNGTVSAAETKSTTLGNKDVEACINKRFLKFKFPEPTGGGIVIASYPFLFSPG